MLLLVSSDGFRYITLSVMGLSYYVNHECSLC